LFWCDSDPGRDGAATAREAARRYREKFGAVPDTCYVNRAALAGEELIVPLHSADDAALRLRPAANIRPHHFWIGVENG
jgi:hypothetical protein